MKNVKLVALAEGRCAQMLHVGPYDKEEPTLEAMKAFRGVHHEIYLRYPVRAGHGSVA